MLRSLPFLLPLLGISHAHAIEKRATATPFCSKVTSVVTALKQQSAATAFCSSYLHIPVSTIVKPGTSTSTIVASTRTSTTTKTVSSGTTATTKSTRTISDGVTTRTVSDGASTLTVSDGISTFSTTDGAATLTISDGTSTVTEQGTCPTAQKRAATSSKPGCFSTYSGTILSSACSCLHIGPSTTTSLSIATTTSTPSTIATQTSTVSSDTTTTITTDTTTVPSATSVITVPLTTITTTVPSATTTTTIPSTTITATVPSTTSTTTEPATTCTPINQVKDGSFEQCGADPDNCVWSAYSFNPEGQVKYNQGSDNTGLTGYDGAYFAEFYTPNDDEITQLSQQITFSGTSDDWELSYSWTQYPTKARCIVTVYLGSQRLDAQTITSSRPNLVQSGSEFHQPPGTSDTLYFYLHCRGGSASGVLNFEIDNVSITQVQE